MSSMTAQSTNSVTRDEEILIAINRQFIQNFLTNDTIAHSKISDSNFLFIGTDGSVHNRSDYMAAWLHGYDKRVMPEFHLEHVQVRVFGNMALIVAKTKDKTMKNGQGRLAKRGTLILI